MTDKVPPLMPRNHLLPCTNYFVLVMLQPAQTAPEPQKAEAAEYVMTVAKDPRYARYLKMVQVVSHFYHLLMDFKKKKIKKSVSCISLHVLSATGSSSYGH